MDLFGLGFVMLAIMACPAVTKGQINECNGANECNTTISVCRDTPTSYVCDCFEGYSHFGQDMLSCGESKFLMSCCICIASKRGRKNL